MLCENAQDCQRVITLSKVASNEVRIAVHRHSSLPNGIQITFRAPARAGRAKGAPCFAQKILEEKAQQNWCLDVYKCWYWKGSVPEHSSGGNYHTSGYTINLSISRRVTKNMYTSLLYITVSVQRLRKELLILSTDKVCVGFYAFIIIASLGERGKKIKPKFSHYTLNLHHSGCKAMSYILVTSSVTFLQLFYLQDLLK